MEGGKKERGWEGRGGKGRGAEGQASSAGDEEQPVGSRCHEGTRTSRTSVTWALKQPHGCDEQWGWLSGASLWLTNECMYYLIET